MHDRYRPIKNTHFAILMLLIGAVTASIEVLLAGPTELTDQRRAELLHLLKHDCGSCHGMTLKGGLGPALTPEALTDKPNDFLEMTIYEGRSGTPMPSWGNILSAAEVSWLVETMKTGVEP
jgi:cytochrome c55X